MWCCTACLSWMVRGRNLFYKASRVVYVLTCNRVEGTSGAWRVICCAFLGAIDTVPLGGLVGNNIFLVPERVTKVARRIKAWVRLR